MFTLMPRHPRSRRRRAAPLALESLESRLALAGDVTVTFTNGTLTVTGDAQGNQIWVSQRGDKTVVSPSPWETNGATRLRFGATVGLPRVQFGGVQTVVVALQGGNDVLVMGGPPSDLLQFRTLTVNLGEGNNSLSAANVIVDQNATLQAGGGFDSIQLDQVQIWGSTSIRTGNGDARVRVSQSWLIGALDVVGGQNNDVVEVQETNASTVRIGTGDGPDMVGIEASVIDVRLDITTGAGLDRVLLGHVGGVGDFAVNTEGGNDVVGAGDWSPGPRSLTVNLGAGQNEAHFGSMVVAGAMTVTGGAGQDSIDFRFTTIQGRLTIDAGDGNNRVSLNPAYAMAVQVTTGLGADHVDIIGATYAGDLRVRTGAGDDMVWMFGIEAGSIDVDLGAGNDVATLQWDVFHRRGLFEGGTGRDTVRTVAGAFGTKFFTGFEVRDVIVL